MIKKLLLAAVLLGMTMPAHAQWVASSSLDTGGWRASSDQSVVEIVHHDQARTYTPEEVALSNKRRDASCRIYANGTVGSGTCFSTKKMKDGRTVGLIITCVHYWPPTDWDKIKVADVKAAFHVDGWALHGCQPLCVDWNHDLMALAAYVDPRTPSLPIAKQAVNGGEGNMVYLCGFGEDGSYRCTMTALKGYTTASWDGFQGKHVPAEDSSKFRTSGHNQIYVNSLKRKGDSGGGIINENNELIGVQWGGTWSDTYGTYSGRVVKFLQDEMPQTYQWTQWGGCQPRIIYGNGCQPQQYMPMPQMRQQRRSPAQSPQMIPLPGVPGVGMTPGDNGGGEIPVPDTGPTEHEQMTEKLDALTAAVEELKEGHQQLLSGQGTMAQALVELPTRQELEELANRLDQGHSQLTGAMAQLQAKVNEVASKEAVVVLKVESGRYISPSYVDVSVLWALQQKTGIDHMVLVTDTSGPYWPRMQGEYEAAKAKMPAIILYDVRSKGVQFKELPQIVIYPTKPGVDPVIVKGTDGVAKVLQAVTRGEMPSSFQGT